ncbi:hypothetical protein F8M41_014973 [Gigaspora margarita]|uniref:Uncharacterized protein n=1 Tax=Gigaspora margarita TaxID=4874 RepID=A0A8H4AR85_GIGMA|nr:hypothetical protein F8M41_014973 [Gigaspora margarita]
MKTKNKNKNKNSRNENGKNVDNDNDMIEIIVINPDLKKHLKKLPRKNEFDEEIKLNNARRMLLKNECDGDDDLHVGSNCRFLHFSNDKAEIKPSDESQFGLLEVVERKDNKYNLHIIQNNEFDLTQLRFEKGFRFYKDGSVTSASIQAFKIKHDEIKIEKKKLQYEGIHECKHETTTECKRSLIFDAKLSTVYSEWISTSIGLSHENSNQTLKQHMKYTKHSYERVIRGEIILDKNKNITAAENFIEDVKNVMYNTTNDNDKLSKLCEISEKHGHFYAQRLILGGIIIRHDMKNLLRIQVRSLLLESGSIMLYDIM